MTLHNCYMESEPILVTQHWWPIGGRWTVTGSPLNFVYVSSWLAS